MTPALAYPIGFLVWILVCGTALWLATIVTRVQISFREAAIVVCAAGLVSLVPWAGGVLGLIVFFLLLRRATGAPVWPDLLLTSVVSTLLSLLISLGIASFFGFAGA